MSESSHDDQVCREVFGMLHKRLSNDGRDQRIEVATRIFMVMLAGQSDKTYLPGYSMIAQDAVRAADILIAEAYRTHPKETA